MDLLLLFIRLTLAAVFATAGAAKLVDLKGAEKAARDFGVGGAFGRFGPVALSMAEIVIAVLLIFPSTSWFAATLAAALLVIFIAMMSYQLIKGNAPDCHCFGQLHSEPVGSVSIIRNIGFLALASILVYRGIDFQGMSVQDIRAEMFPAIFSFIAVLLLAAMVMYMRSVSRKQSEILRRIELLELISRDSSEVRRDEAGDPHLGRPIGAWFPRFNLPDSSGRPVTLDDLRQNSRPLLFIFVAPGCEPCAALVPEIGEWKQQFAGRVDIVLFSSGDVEQNRAKFGKTSDMLLIDDGREIATAAGARWTPTAVFVDANGKIASQIAAGDQAIRELVEKISAARLDGPLTYFTRRDHHGRGLKIGETVPEFTLEDLEGRSVNDADLKGRSTLVAFWSTRCPHCERMLPELKEWERSRRNGDPGLIVFSDGDVEEHRALELRSPVVLDKGYKVAEKLGMFGTPSAVLIDESGTIISETAVGAENIWSLLAPKQ